MGQSHSQPRSQNLPPASSPGSSDPGSQAAIAALYTIEREAGFSVQTNLLTVWIAATTYFTAVLGILALLLDVGKDLDLITKVVLMAALPLPACALAGYHLILSGIGFIRSRSIELLEQELVNAATWKVKNKYHLAVIGSKGETAWTDREQASWLMQVTSGVAYVVPYLSAVLVTLSCSLQILITCKVWPAIVVVVLYGALLAAILSFGYMTLPKKPKAAKAKPGPSAKSSKLRPRRRRFFPWRRA